ncbi:MAG: hypothetical protein IJR00_11225 [Lachnospiraceae bacterium]|nr:hypothetical protein [Lachnospiraceae bacterium]MBQ6904293.1 hypothetical protein [Lachnospiraceae bacterium]
MTQVNMLEAKTNLSRLVAMLENGEENVIYVARNGKPVVQMTLSGGEVPVRRLGVAKGVFTCPKEFDAWDDEISDMFEGI